MKALRTHAFGEPPVLEDVAEPTPAAGEALVKVDAATISRLDLTIASGTFGVRPELPYVGGVEGAGTVISSERFVPGERVLLRGGGLGLKRDGTWQATLAVADTALSPLPPGLPSAAATFFGPAATAYVALHDLARVQSGDHVAVTGAAGAVGTMAVQLAMLAGAIVTGIVGRASHLSALPAGVTSVLMSDPEQTAALAKDRPFDSLIDTVGGPELIAHTAWVRAGGSAVALGYTAGEKTTIDIPNWLLDDVALLPLNMMRRGVRSREVSGELAERIAGGELQVSVEEVAPDQAADAISRLVAGDVAGRVVIAF